MPDPADTPPLEKPASRDRYAKVTEIMGIDEVEAEADRLMREVLVRGAAHDLAERCSGGDNPKPET